MLEGIEVRLSCRYPVAGIDYATLVYSGKLDALFNYKYGRLEYRSLSFVQVPHQLHQHAVNYCDKQVPYTRDVDYRHFGGSVTMREYPVLHTDHNVPMYPVRDHVNLDILAKYQALHTSAIVGGRLGSFRYLDMDKVIAQAIHDAI